MLITRTRHVTWFDALRYWLLRLTRPAETALPRHITAQPVADLQLGACSTAGYVNVGRRFPIHVDRLDTFYRAANEDF